jgi:putative hydrolase of the HAD superfamily
MRGRIINYTMSLLRIGREEAEKIWAEKSAVYGSTLAWYQAELEFSRQEEFLARVHPPEELEEIPFDPRLRDFLLSLKLPMSILTNGPLAHAERVLEYLEVADLFREIWAIERIGFQGKPQKSAYLCALSSGGLTLEDTVFFDDNLKYVEAYASLGGRGVLVNPRQENPIPGIPRIDSIYDIHQILGAAV